MRANAETRGWDPRIGAPNSRICWETPQVDQWQPPCPRGLPCNAPTLACHSSTLPPHCLSLLAAQHDFCSSGLRSEEPPGCLQSMPQTWVPCSVNHSDCPVVASWKLSCLPAPSAPGSPAFFPPCPAGSRASICSGNTVYSPGSFSCPGFHGQIFIANLCVSLSRPVSANDIWLEFSPVPHRAPHQCSHSLTNQTSPVWLISYSSLSIFCARLQCSDWPSWLKASPSSDSFSPETPFSSFAKFPKS